MQLRILIPLIMIFVRTWNRAQLQTKPLLLVEPQHHFKLLVQKAVVGMLV